MQVGAGLPVTEARDGMAVEAEYYWRKLDDFEGVNTSGIADIKDHGYQVQLSAMPIRNS